MEKQKLNPCPKCGGMAILVVDYDFEYVICADCGSKTETIIGDYYDEGFMDGSYCIHRWNNGSIEE